MKTPRIVPLALVPLALVASLGLARPARLLSQSDSGKIKDVGHSAGHARKQGGDHGDHGDDDGWFVGGTRFFVRAVWHTIVYVPSDTGQGYLAYPYARFGGPSFVVPDVAWGRSFGTVSATYFRDAGSTLRGGHVAIEWAGGMFDRTIEYSFFREPTATGTDHLSMLHAGVALLPPLGDLGYLKVGLAFQGVFTDQGDVATGPELVLGAQLLPKRPFGVAATARVAPLTWAGGPAFSTGFVDLIGTGSVFLGRFELQAGYRWTRVGVGAPFSGPTLGLKAWF
jgi:hypothetical protein